MRARYGARYTRMNPIAVYSRNDTVISCILIDISRNSHILVSSDVCNKFPEFLGIPRASKMHMKAKSN